MGNPPAKIFLTAYGLMEFIDMAKVYPVDEAVIERAAKWLLKQQQADGTWNVSDYRAGQGALGATAYATWALVQAGYEDTPQVAKAISYLREFALQEQDAYNLAFVANALAAYAPDDAMTNAVLDRLYDMRAQDGDNVYWQAGDTFMGATGDSGSIETTALAAYAFLQADAHPDAVTGTLAYLVRAKDSWGTWSTTQATILSLRTLLLASEKAGRSEGPATILVTLNQEQTQQLTIDQTNADVVHLVTFDRGFSPTGANRVQIELQGGGNLMAQVATSYYLPWNLVPPVPEKKEQISIDVAYDRTALAVNDEVTVSVDVRLNVPGVVKMALVDLGVPPGFTVLTEDLSRLVEQGLIARYELTGRQIIVYLEDFSAETPLAFSYRLRARFPMRAQTPPSGAYDYYNPTHAAERAPLHMIVNE
ncbi:MAG: hypothetical protein JXA89_00710 [Anaerolineae bacterium]|nr:hypothetical protein [Anaerolineae bacterium]